MHPNDGDLRSFLDGELPDEARSSVADHLRDCSTCRQRRDALAGLDTRVREALQGLPVPPTRTARAREAVRRRLSATGDIPATDPSMNGRRAGAAGGADVPARDRRRRRTGGRSGTGGDRAWMRAAGFVLLLVGGVAAGLPGSPVREWVGSLGGGPDPSATAVESAAPAEADGPRPDAAVRLAPTGDSVLVSVVGAAPGTRIRIDLVDDDVVEVSAAGDTRFRTGATRVEVLDASTAVTVRLPSDLGSAVVDADGSVLVRKRGDATAQPTLAADTVDGGLVFTLPPSADVRSP